MGTERTKGDLQLPRRLVGYCRSMGEELGLRERKKLRTREAISAAAIRLFLESGFDAVGVAEVARVAEVAKRTLFAYFPTKEDLVVHRFADHATESADVVRARPAEQSPLEALREDFLKGLNEREPVTGLAEDPEVLGVFRMMAETPTLAARMLSFKASEEAALAEALAETGATPLAAALGAAQITAVRWSLATANMASLAAGATAAERYPEAVEAAEQGFAMLRDGLRLN